MEQVIINKQGNSMGQKKIFKDWVLGFIWESWETCGSHPTWEGTQDFAKDSIKWGGPIGGSIMPPSALMMNFRFKPIGGTTAERSFQELT